VTLTSLLTRNAFQSAVSLSLPLVFAFFFSFSFFKSQFRYAIVIVVDLIDELPVCPAFELTKRLPVGF
jgi:hypothetical protein